jgi:hypothetical protein
VGPLPSLHWQGSVAVPCSQMRKGPAMFFEPNSAGRACTTSGLELTCWDIVQLDWYAVVLGTNLHRFQGISGEQEEPLRSEELNPAVSIYVKRDRRSWLRAFQPTHQHNPVLGISNQTCKFRRMGAREASTSRMDPDELRHATCVGLDNLRPGAEARSKSRSVSKQRT